MLERKYKVYIIKSCKTNAIVYVGLTRQELKLRFQAHVAKFKFNRNEFKIELVIDGLTILEAAELEKKLIEQYKTLETGWNKSPGSINGFSNYHSEEQKLKWSLERKGKPVSQEHAAKNRIARIGHKNNETWRKAQFESHAKAIICLETNKVYRSAREAAKDLNLQYSKISNVCTGKRKSTGGYTFKFFKNSRDEQK